MLQLGPRLQSVRERIAAAEKRAGRKPGSVILIAVSKTVGFDNVLMALKSGVVDFGENYVQEAIKKIEKIKNSVVGLNPRWHLIGSLQTNKSKNVVGKFETIQTVDRAELAISLNKRAQESGIIQNILIQVKLGDEPTKAGIEPEKISKLIDQLGNLKNLRVEGLMSLPPIEAEPESSRKFFIQLRELLERHQGEVSSHMGSFRHLSMGTTHDFEIAIEEGATMTRVGAAIFGPREVDLGP